MVDRIALPLAAMQASIAEATTFLGDCPHALAKAASSARVAWYLVVMRQQPMALHARRSLISKAPWRWATAFRLAAASPFLFHEVLQPYCPA